MIINIEDEFTAPKESISWAQEATTELSGLISNFFKGDNARIVVEINPDTGEHVQKLKFLADIPKHFRRKATEALVHARHSFDQTIFAARNVTTKRSDKGINYPWAQTPTDLDLLMEKRQLYT